MKRLYNSLLLFIISIIFVQAQNFPEDGAVYRLVNTFRENAMLAEDYGLNKLYCMKKIDGDYRQLWKFIKNGDGWNIQNIFTGRYIQHQTEISEKFSTDVAPAVMYVSRNNGFDTECYNIVNTSGGGNSVHCSGDYNGVLWYSAVNRFEGSEWTYEKVDISDEEIAAARAKYNTFNNIRINNDSVEAVLLKYFTDESCSKLKSEYQSISDDELKNALKICGDVITNIAIKVKNGTWAPREKEFRVHTYEPYSNPDHWTSILKISPYSFLNNPTGICGSDGDILYIFVGKEPKEGSVLQLDAVTGNSPFGVKTELKKGLNIIPIVRNDLTFFINYVADTRKNNVLADFDSIPIHIEGGYVNGYWDKSRHNDEDWVDITRNFAKHRYMYVKGEREAFFMELEYMIKDNCCPDSISDAIGWWDNMVKWQHEIMGIEDYYPSRFNNRLCAVSITDGFQAAGAYETFHVRTILTNILPIRNAMKNSDNAWGPSHENGHIHQAAINMIRCGEVSNNLFSNVVTHKLGKFVTWGTPNADIVKDFENNVPWTLRNIGIMMRMYFQLYLYYHAAGNNPQFYPNLFKLLREDPLKKASGDETQNSGREDLLKFALKCSEAAGEDLTDFFEAHGFFVPMINVTIGDYGSYTINSTQRMINDTKKKMAKYTKRAGAVQFIEDRINPARTDGGEGLKLEYVPGKYGDVGQYTAFVPDSMDVIANGYVYCKAGKNITISDGSGAVGFKVYSSSDSTLLTFSNFYEIELSDKMVANSVYVMAVSANGTEVVVKSKNDGDEDEQLESLDNAITLSQLFLEYKDKGNKYVGFYFESSLVNLISLVDSANLVIENRDQSVHTYGEWAALIDNEISKIIADGDNNRVKIQPGNTYKLYNVRYPNYSMFYDNGSIVCRTGETSPKSRYFTLVPTGKDNEFYLSTNGKYINLLKKDSPVTATTNIKSEAVKFNIGEYGFAQYYLHNISDINASLHCAAGYSVVGWDYNNEQSLWSLVCTDIKKEKADEKELKALIVEADSIYNLIVDTLNTSSITFKEDIKVISETLAADVDSMVSLVSESNNTISQKYYNEYPSLIERLTSVISSVKSGYTVSTGICDILIDEKEHLIYDIRGRKVKNITSSGVYIIDGKKVYIE